ncbi:hypothetical protein DH2020_015627 [Rehmannia glutinosa]|uniref:Homeobox domain-containing protein n=1 Tax=Rehmannia glutinosa TaxID=99300 RepID=A0ABR0WU12_REHGL
MEQGAAVVVDEEGVGNNNSNNKSSSNSYLCRQSSTRWTPTTDQIRILKDLYYNNGVRSPTAEQIQRISAKLRQYGKIEGKNVFYWFQNHKARERQKKRFTTTSADIPTTMPIHRPAFGPNNNNWKYHHQDHHLMISPGIYNNNHFSNITPAAGGNFPSSSSANLLTVGNYGYGSVAMEKSFRECSITPSANPGGSTGHKFAWIGVDPYSSSSSSSSPSCYPFLDQKKKYTTNCTDQTLEMEEEEEEEEIETLPLFPMHGDIKQETEHGWHRHADEAITASPRASLELTLNSYAARFPTTS